MAKGACPCGLPDVRVRDLNPFGRRLRAAMVSFEDRQDLLGHRAAPSTRARSRSRRDNPDTLGR